MLQECCGATIREWMEVKQHQTTISSDPKAEQTAGLKTYANHGAGISINISPNNHPVLEA